MNTGGRVGLEERELENKLAQLNRELARAGEELSRSSAVSTETELAATEAGLAAQRAAEEARLMQVKNTKSCTFRDANMYNFPWLQNFALLRIWLVSFVLFVQLQ